MARLILVRHGETAWNAQARYQGQSDPPLSEAGRRQAASLSSYLAREEIDAIHASDLQRAWDTALTIAGPHGLPVHADRRLREMDFGAWEGLTYTEVQTHDPSGLAAWEADPLNVAPSGGETLRQVAARVRSVLDDMARIEWERTVVLVSHGGPLRVLLCMALGLEPQAHWQFRLGIASLSELYACEVGADIGRASGVLTRLNDTHHLEMEAGLDRGEAVWGN
jgi:probable phosphoglycerate mutase